ncbi:MAG: XRE family transcriptional regulator [Endomicrobium sp.]|nr:XRE family transcriptional regulator [Endomicrobium sp.]
MQENNKNQLNTALKASINPNILKWAREAIGVSCLDVVKKINKKSITETNLTNWENGNDFPTVGVAKILAKAYGIKFITLYLPDIPKNIKPLKDFRGVETPNNFSKNFVFLMREIQGKQEWLREYLLSQKRESLTFVGSLAISDSIDEVVSTLNKILLSDIEMHSKAENSLKTLTKKIESLGVFISIGSSFNGNYRNSVQPSEVRGFAIADKIAPFIFINSKDTKNAQLFTLIHEFCHLLLGETGISDTSSDNQNPIESFCNKATAEFLMPTDKFIKVWHNNTRASLYDKIEILSAKFPTSPLSIIIKIFSLKLISKDTFNNTYKDYKNKLMDSINVWATKQKNRSYAANPYHRSFYINGKSFIEIVFEAYSNTAIMIKNACSLLGVKTGKMDIYEHRWSKYL